MDNNTNNELIFGKMNYILMIAGVAIIAIGFILMTGGRSEDWSVFNPDEVYSTVRITVAPIVVLIGFLVEIAAIMYKTKE